uniref:DnaJ homolog subfamily C member 9-like n=1 Tax=Phallusia mammillata TaxID=59560 RepID=A0A6F9DAM7_9ASCI|nr:dnaJ homolog subfamily C member 9-like [Phallusia mammillata]
MGLLDECEKLFETRDLYELLSVAKESSETEIKRAYRKLSLRVHPDRCQDDTETATKKFQVLSKASKLLLDKESREIYDREGTVDEGGELNEENLKNWTQYWKTLFHFTVDDLKKFEDSYKFSEEEVSDLKTIYVECEGDMDLIFEKQICCTIEDEPRFREILLQAIKADEVPSFDKFVKESKAKRNRRKRKFEKEAQEVKESMNDLGIDNESDLKQLILQRQSNREQQMGNFFDQLEAKYAKPTKGKKSSTRGKKNKK